MRVVAHHGIEGLLPAVVGVLAIAVHYLRALVRLRSGSLVGRRSGRRPVQASDALDASTAEPATPTD